MTSRLATRAERALQSVREQTRGASVLTLAALPSANRLYPPLSIFVLLQAVNDY
jgi:hypothetical protein